MKTRDTEPQRAAHSHRDIEEEQVATKPAEQGGSDLPDPGKGNRHRKLGTGIDDSEILARKIGEMQKEEA